jgi:hypothetical protein
VHIPREGRRPVAPVLVLRVVLPLAQVVVLDEDLADAELVGEEVSEERVLIWSILALLACAGAFEVFELEKEARLGVKIDVLQVLSE